MRRVFDTLPEMHKRPGVFLAEKCECTPVVLGGELLTITFEREASHGTGILVNKLESKDVVARLPWDHGLGCAIVVDERLHVFGSSDWGDHNHVATATISHDWKIGETKIVLEAVDRQKIFNTSVSPCPGGHVMAYEVDEPGMVNFSIRFARSPDLVNWERVGGVFEPDVYAACPTIRYHDGWYYILYLRRFKHYVTCIARTRDLVSFQRFDGNARWPSSIAVLSPRGCPEEGINNSDIDMVEWHGHVVFTYCDGDQQTWMNLRTAVYLGSAAQFFREFFP
ncbi:MAG: hypothetical protein GYA24_18290 [Candidatus Lokiarchaeota archaeon]|nr:hypothetical protein [Candidatus Lokiarchaeota archaeon]